MSRHTAPTGFPQPSKLRVIEAIGVTIALGGLTTIGAAIWSLFDRPDRYGITLVCVAVGVGLVILGVDLVVRPAARRIPKVRGLIEFLRWRAGLGP